MPKVTDKCIGCGVCVNQCPVNAIKINPETSKAEIDQEICIKCGKCVTVCPANAIKEDKES